MFPFFFFFSILLVDDDIDDEEFYDEHLEAYFEQLAIPGMLYEDLGQEPPENDFKLPTSDSCQVCSNFMVFQKFDFRKLLLVSLDITIKHKLLVFFDLFFKIESDKKYLTHPFLLLLTFPSSAEKLKNITVNVCMPLIQINQLLTIDHLCFLCPSMNTFLCII